MSGRREAATQVPDTAGDDARELPFAEAMEAWGPRKLLAELRRIGWGGVLVLDGPADPREARRNDIKEQLLAWFQRQVADGSFAVSVLASDSALSARRALPASWADSLSFGRYGWGVARNGRPLRDVRVRLRVSSVPAVADPAGMPLDGAVEPMAGGWFPLADAELTFAPPDLRARHESAVAAVRRFPRREVYDLMAGGGGVGWVGAEGEARRELSVAAAALLTELQRALEAGELEARGKLDPIDGAWICWTASAWPHLRLLTGNRVGSGVRGDARKWHGVQVRQPLPEPAVAPAEAVPEPIKPTKSDAKPGSPEYRATKYKECIDWLLSIAERSPKERTINKDAIRDKLKLIWPEMSAKAYEDISRLLKIGSGAAVWCDSLIWA